MIACVAGGQANMLCGHIAEGITPVLVRHGKFFSLYPCGGDWKLEAKAFESMLYNKADAIIHIPAPQYADPYSYEHILEVLRQYPKLPPILSVYGGTNYAGFHQIRFREWETGRKAALRHLECGCRKFGLITTRPANIFALELARGYRETLLENGIAPQNLVEVGLGSPILPDAYAPLRDVEGLWCSYYVIFILTSKFLLQVCDLSRMHVDTVFSDESTQSYLNLLPCTATSDSPRSFSGWFGSCVVHKFNLHDLGVRAAETAVRLSDAPDTPPGIDYIDFKTETYHYGD